MTLCDTKKVILVTIVIMIYTKFLPFSRKQNYVGLLMQKNSIWSFDKILKLWGEKSIAAISNITKLWGIITM